jgi:anion-transporting  ArsA/GET3 family ATPase
MERELSAIDVIYKMYEKLEELEKKIQAIDDNIKILNNKVTKINKIGNQLSEQKPTSVAYSQPTEQEQVAEPVIRQPDKLLLGTTKVFGYIVNRMKEPVDSVVVNIFDQSNNLVKSSKSNKDGYWDFRLPSGGYSIQYVHSKFKPINKPINIPNGAKEFEVK